jgi:hypothetical protein
MSKTRNSKCARIDGAAAEILREVARRSPGLNSEIEAAKTAAGRQSPVKAGFAISVFFGHAALHTPSHSSRQLQVFEDGARCL